MVKLLRVRKVFMLCCGIWLVNFECFDFVFNKLYFWNIDLVELIDLVFKKLLIIIILNGIISDLKIKFFFILIDLYLCIKSKFL